MKKYYSTSESLGEEIANIPSNEPFVIIRASQIGSPDALSALRAPIVNYLSNMDDRDMSENRNIIMATNYAIKDLSEYFRDWQVQNPDKKRAY